MLISIKYIYDINSYYVEYHTTCPGRTTPTAGETVIGTPSGTLNSNDVGQTGAISPTS